MGVDVEHTRDVCVGVHMHVAILRLILDVFADSYAIPLPPAGSQSFSVALEPILELAL